MKKNSLFKRIKDEVQDEAYSSFCKSICEYMASVKNETARRKNGEILDLNAFMEDRIKTIGIRAWFALGDHFQNFNVIQNKISQKKLTVLKDTTIQLMFITNVSFIKFQKIN